MFRDRRPRPRIMTSHKVPPSLVFSSKSGRELPVINIEIRALRFINAAELNRAQRPDREGGNRVTLTLRWNLYVLCVWMAATVWERFRKSTKWSRGGAISLGKQSTRQRDFLHYVCVPYLEQDRPGRPGDEGGGPNSTWFRFRRLFKGCFLTPRKRIRTISRLIPIGKVFFPLTWYWISISLVRYDFTSRLTYSQTPSARAPLSAAVAPTSTCLTILTSTHYTPFTSYSPAIRRSIKNEEVAWPTGNTDEGCCKQRGGARATISTSDVNERRGTTVDVWSDSRGAN